MWFVITWAFVADHDAQTCRRVVQAVHIALVPCVCNPSSLSKHPKFIRDMDSNSFPKVSPSIGLSNPVPDGSHSGDVNAGICIFRTEEESYGSADLVLRMSHPRRHLGLLQEGRRASINSIHCVRWYRMFPQLWGGVYGVASWCMYSDHRCFCLWLTVETVFNGAPGRSPFAIWY